MQNSIKAVIFDIDRTLLDTEQYILQAFVHTLQAYNLHSITKNELNPLMGKSLEKCYEILAPHENVTALAETHRTFQEKNLQLAVPFPHTIRTLQKIKEHDIKIAAVTTRTMRTSKRTLEVTGLIPFINAVISKEDVKPEELKPHPRPILFALELIKSKPEFAVTVGDAKEDIEAGKRAGTKTIGVTYGSSGIQINECHPDYVIDDIADILLILQLL